MTTDRPRAHRAARGFDLHACTGEIDSADRCGERNLEALGIALQQAAIAARQHEIITGIKPLVIADGNAIRILAEAQEVMPLAASGWSGSPARSLAEGQVHAGGLAIQHAGEAPKAAALRLRSSPKGGGHWQRHRIRPRGRYR